MLTKIKVLIIFLWYSADIADDLMIWHVRAGKLLLALLIARVAWGFCGSQTARFADFIRSPKEFFNYLPFIKKTEKNNEIGHNPTGGYMVVIMMAVLFVQSISGLGNSDDIFIEGSLYRYLNENTAELMAKIHYNNFYILLILIAMHLLAIASYYLSGNNLVLPMVSGYKKIQKATKPPYFINAFWALGIFLIVVAMVFWVLE